jgi:hypothetical protein
MERLRDYFDYQNFELGVSFVCLNFDSKQALKATLRKYFPTEFVFWGIEFGFCGMGFQ